MTQPTDTKAQQAIQELQKVFSKLTPENRESLARAGVTIPQGDLSSIVTGKYKFGLRCTKCNKVGLYFVGTEWEIRGEKVEVPPALPHWEIAWTQHLAPSDIDRHEPRCQHCQVVLPLQQSGAFDYGNQLLGGGNGTDRSKLVIVEEFEASRDRAYDRKNVREYRRKRDQGPGDISQAGVSSDYNANQRKVSDVINEKFGEGTAERLDKVAAETGVADYVPSKG